MTCRQSKGAQVTREDWDRLLADIEVALAVPSSRRPLASLTQEQKEAYSMLTKQQRKLLEVIQESLTSNGSAPSFDEMKDALGLKSKSGVHRLIKGLEERGFIRRLPHRARALEVCRYAEDQLDAKTLATRVAFLEAENAELRARLSEVSNSKMQVAA